MSQKKAPMKGMELINNNSMNFNYSAGVYAILNVVTNESYVGSTQEFHTRRLTHLSRLRKNKKPSLILQKAFNEYGESSFLFVILEVCHNLGSLERVEQKWVDTLIPEYNHDKVVRRYVFTKERNKKISKTLQSSIKKGVDNPLYQVKRPRDVVERIFNTRAAIGKDKLYKKVSHVVLQFDFSGNLIKEWASVNDAYKGLGIHRDKISAICRGTWRYKNNTGFTFKYKNNEILSNSKEVG